MEAEVGALWWCNGPGHRPRRRLTGMHEAIDLRDGGEDLGGFGVETALDNLADRIAPRLNGMEATDQEDIDLAMIDLDDTD